MTIEQNTVKVESVILCNKSTRGNGKTTPFRTITEIFDFDGSLIAENDPLCFSFEQILSFIKFRTEGEEQIRITDYACKYFLSEFGKEN